MCFRSSVTTWGDSNSESEDSEPDCLMANEVDSESDEDDEDIQVTDLKPELISHEDLIALSKCLIDENASYSHHVQHLKDETTHLNAEIKFLKHANAEMKRYARPLKPCTTICPDCKGKAKVNESSLEVTTLDQIMTKLDSIYDSIEAK